ELLYSAGGNEFVNATVEGNILTLTPIADGSGVVTVYASDLKELVPATFHVTVTLNGTPIIVANETNVTLNETVTNETENTTQSNVTLTSLDCSNSNPNLRPVECL